MNDCSALTLEYATRDYGVLQRLGFWPVAASLGPGQVEVRIHILNAASPTPSVVKFGCLHGSRSLLDQVGKLYYRAVGAVMQDRLIGYADLYHGHVEGLTAALKATHDDIKARGGTILPSVPTPEAIQRMYPTQEGEQA